MDTSLLARHVGTSILAMLGAMTGSLANSALAGIFFDAAGLAVMSVVLPFYFLFSVIGSLIGVGGATAAAYALGRDDTAGANNAFSISVCLCMFFSLLLGLGGSPYLSDVLYIFGATEEIHAAAYEYALVYIWGGFGTALFYLPFNFLRLSGQLRLIIGLFLGLAVLNILLDLFFIQVVKLGIAGIALGTVIASILTALLGIFALLRGEAAFRFVRKWNLPLALQLMRLGSPAAANNLLTFFRLILMNRLILALAGATGLAAFSVVTALENFSLIILSGLAQGTAPFISVLTREQDTLSVRHIERNAHIIGFVLIGLMTAIISFFPTEIAALFGLAGMELTAAAEAAYIFAFSLLPSVCCYLMFFYYQAAGFTTLANVLVFSRTFLFILLPAWLLSDSYGLPGVWWSFTIASLSPLFLMLTIKPFFARRGYAGFLLQDLTAERTGKYLSFAVKADTSSIISKMDELEDFCAQNSLTSKETMLVRMSMEEMLLSIKEHACMDSKAVLEGRVLLMKKFSKNTIILRIRSTGKMFNPLEYYRNLQNKDPLALQDALGIAMVLRFADEIHYKTTFGINNLMVKIQRK